MNIEDVATYIHGSTDPTANGEPCEGADIAAGLAVLLMAGQGISLYSAAGPLMLGESVVTKSGRYGVTVMVHDATPEVVAYLVASGGRTGSADGTEWVSWRPSPRVEVTAYPAKVK